MRKFTVFVKEDGSDNTWERVFDVAEAKDIRKDLKDIPRIENSVTRTGLSIGMGELIDIICPTET